MLTTTADTSSLPAGQSPMDPERAKQAVIKLIAAYARAHGAMPSRKAVHDLWEMLAEEPRSELIGSELKTQLEKRRKNATEQNAGSLAGLGGRVLTVGGQVYPTRF
jgi:hypothetical protein